MSSSQSRLVMARSKRTRQIDIRRANEFSLYSAPTNPEHVLHYVGTDGTRVCRCDEPEKHFSHTITVAKENRYLAVSLMLYLTRHGYESCTLAAFRKYGNDRKAMWRAQGVDMDNFHYMSDAKDKVCRCSRPNGHNAGAPRHPEIIEQCADFFIVHKDAKFCRRNEWQGIEGDSPPVYTHPVPASSSPTSTRSPRFYKPAYSPGSQQDAFEYDSRSTRHFFQGEAQRVAKSPEMQTREIEKPSAIIYAQQPPSGPHGEPDIPVQVWQTARPSVWIPSHISDSDITTPLGTALPQTLASTAPEATVTRAESNNQRVSASSALPHAFAPAASEAPVAEVESTNIAQRASVSTCWSNIQHDADDSAGHSSRTSCASSIHTTRRPISQASDYTVKPESVHENLEMLPLQDSESGPDNVSRPFRHELSSRTHETVPISNNYELHATSIAELPGQIAALEIGAGIRKHPQRRSAARNFRAVTGCSELSGKRTPVHAPHASSQVSSPTVSSSRLSLLLEKVHDQVRLPDQEELLLHHTVVSSRSNPAPAGACTECNEPFQDRQKRTIMLSECEHFIHEECLLESFRMRDQRIGTCPICNGGLCERTLADRMDTDHMGIFGSQFTRLRNQVSIEFPQHNEVVTCASEEELAAAQLRIVKDYVDVHSEENFRVWELNRAEPDWFMGVVRPVVKLFQAWDVPDRQCRFFVDHEHFLKLLAWAELVRLMNYGRKASLSAQGEAALYPQLAQLHHKFTMALERYDKEKLVWDLDEGRIPECDQVAQDVVDLAIRIQWA
ncbi:hypothetical protein NX059_004562 [Plenodomus lindquistii]|nr:hypothetical protein NX059_004562 [Plenodomus lindquistii]